MPTLFDAESRAPRLVRWALASLIVAAACSDRMITSVTATDAGAADLKSQARVVVDPATVSATVGDSGGFIAIVTDYYGNVVSNPTVRWRSEDTSVVQIRPDGFAVAVGVGFTRVRATSGGRNGYSLVTVSAPSPPPAPEVTTVEVTPGSAGGAVGDSAQFAAVARDANGAEIADRLVIWSSTDTTVAVVSSSGMGRAVGPGSAQLVATIDGISGHSDVTVIGAPPPPPPPPPPPAVASVTIAPSSVGVTTGNSTQLVATVRDGSGNELTGRAVSWSSSNGLVAAVSGSGLVTGLVFGSVTVTATSEGVAGTASVSVSLLPPPPPPPTGAWPNMPGTYSVVTEQPFDPLQVVNWELIWNNNGYGTITTNATAPLPGSSVFQVRYPAGFTAGSAPATQWFPLSGRRNVFIGMWWKANANWQGHESNVNKLHFLYHSNGGGDVYMTAYGPPGGPYHLRINLQLNGGDSRSWLVPNVGSGNVTMGDWHRIEWLVEYNTSGANGVVRWWLDGQLVGNYTDVLFPAGGFDEYKLSPTWGGMGGIAKQQTDYFWFDHVTISSR